MRNADIVQTIKYRGTPKPEIDASWLKIGLGPSGIRLDEDDLRRLNKSDMPGRPLYRIPEELGGGYPATLEAFHLLHCLGSLRKATYSEYYAEEIQKTTEAAWRIHTDHCIDMICETIMCSSDVTPITYYDNEAVPGRRLPMPDFPTVHTCRNFEEILSWNNDNDRALKWDEIGLDLGDDSLPRDECGHIFSKIGQRHIMKVIECAQMYEDKGDDMDMEFVHYSLVLTKGTEIFKAQSPYEFKVSQDINIKDLEYPPIPIPHEDLWPPFTDDLTVAPHPLPDNAYTKRRRVCDYEPNTSGIKPCKAVIDEARVCELLRKHPHKNVATYLGCIHNKGLVTDLCFVRYKEQLSDRVNDSTRPLDASACLEGIKQGLDHLHSLGLNHNDVNPSNIMLDEQDVPIIIDFDSCHKEGELLDFGGTHGWTDGSSWSTSLRKHDDFALEQLRKYLFKDGFVEIGCRRPNEQI